MFALCAGNGADGIIIAPPYHLRSALISVIRRILDAIGDSYVTRLVIPLFCKQTCSKGHSFRLVRRDHTPLPRIVRRDHTHLHFRLVQKRSYSLAFQTCSKRSYLHFSLVRREYSLALQSCSRDHTHLHFRLVRKGHTHY
ncbi:hypothetical protein CEXT_412741 [Caerostris extrusa]|uniref:Uncharacterized protein n=1 Tax=Caerostris extrusa TaxID=172846 RepID=A0AAV4XU75_CAEEX|nr:hypothetical protein CEXT_412741 [Caerostris extrusa]